jgi:cyclopropane-fatty-acyl-phospholipid synthase
MIEYHQSMATKNLITEIQKLLRSADIEINGDRKWDIQIKDEIFYDRIIKSGSLGLGESYMDGQWECDDLEELFHRLLKNKIEQKFHQVVNLNNLLDIANIKLFSKEDPYKVGRQHYDLGNDLYERMLGKTMAYSCGYWENAQTLDEAQTNKFELICQKLMLEPGMRVIDIGCGWGGLIAYMAEKYKVECVGLTVSVEQKKKIDETYSHLPVECHLMDYREYASKAKEKFDRVVSVGMFEHVKVEFYPAFMKTANDLLKDQGLFLLHTIGNQYTNNLTDDWIDKYIFPESKLPSIGQLSKPSEEFFVMEDWHNFGPDYHKTLLAWHENFTGNWSEIKDKYGDRFYRMWEYYLLSCAGGFRSRFIQLWQVVLSKNRDQVYKSFR